MCLLALLVFELRVVEVNSYDVDVIRTKLRVTHSLLHMLSCKAVVLVLAFVCDAEYLIGKSSCKIIETTTRDFLKRYKKSSDDSS